MRIFKTFMIMLIGLLSLSFGVQSRQDKADNPIPFRVGYSSTTLLDVNIKDAEAATKVLNEILVRKKRPDMPCETRIFTDLGQLSKAVSAGQVDVLTLVPYEYLFLQDEIPTEPVFISVINGKDLDNLVLLVHKDRVKQPFRALFKKRLLINISQGNEFPKYWLESLLNREGVPSSERFFSGVEIVSKSSQAVLPVFFRQADACIVLNSAFQTMAELNPQIGIDLAVLRASPKAPRGIICIAKNLRPELNREEIIDSLAGLHLDPVGQQLLKIFKVDKLVRFKPSYLDGTRAVIDEYQQLTQLTQVERY